MESDEDSFTQQRLLNMQLSLSTKFTLAILLPNTELRLSGLTTNKTIGTNNSSTSR